MPTLRVLKGVIDVRQDAAGRTIYVLPPTRNRKFSWVKQGHGTKPTAIKQHYTHTVYAINKAQAHRSTMR